MAGYSQATRLMGVSTPLGEDALLLTSFRAQAGLSELFEFDLDMLAENDRLVDFNELLGREVTVRITSFPELKRFYSGVVTEFVKGKRDQTFTRYRAEVRPRLWLLTQNVQSRVFQQQSVREILEKVLLKTLKSSEFHFHNFLGNYPKRNYCVQYRESDFAFLSRLMEEEGITYYFRHGESGHELMITDTPIDRLEPAEARLAFDDAEGGVRTEPRITSWEVRQAVRTGQYVVRDYSFALPDQTLEYSEPIQTRVRVGSVEHKLTSGNVGLEAYDHRGGYAGWFDGVDPGGADRSEELGKISDQSRHVAERRIGAEAAQAIRIDGAGTCAAFHPGFHFELIHPGFLDKPTKHPDDGHYLISRVEHVARLSGFRSGEDVRLDYSNTFSCLPSGLPYRPPRRTPRPTIAGTQTAVVVGPVHEDVFLDKYGRVKVQFHWDRQGKKDAGSSCWLRVAQVWAGKGWGAFFWPRIGQEVIVSFEEGDPDRPIVVGSVYNEQNRPPFFPVQPLVNGIKSCSEHGEARSESNGLLFHDRKGHEHLQIHSERDEVFHTESDKHVQVGGNLVTLVGGLGAGRSNGSGSGSGDDGHDTPLFEEHISPKFSTHIEASFGAKADLHCFYESSHLVGHEMRWVVNPLAMAASKFLHGLHNGHPPHGPWGFVSALGGEQTFTLGAGTNLHYGPNVNISRGPHLDYSGDLTVGWGLFATGVAAVSMATTICAGKDYGLGSIALGIASASASFGLTNLFTTIEIANAVSLAAREKAKEAKEVLAHAMVALGMTKISAGAADDATGLAASATALVAQAATPGAPVPPNPHRFTSYSGNHTMNAHNITLRSSFPPNLVAVPPVPGGPTMIHLDAQGTGSGNPMNGGTVRVTATKAIDVLCDGEPILIQSGPSASGGSVTLSQGQVSPQMVGRRVRLEDEGIELAVGNQGMPLAGIPPRGPRIKIDDSSITLAVGMPATGASIMIQSTGIILKFGRWELQVNQGGITMVAAGSNIKIEPGEIVLKALNLTLGDDQAMLDIHALMEQAGIGAAVRRQAAIVQDQG